MKKRNCQSALAKLRRARKYTQAEAARKLRISHVTICRLETIPPEKYTPMERVWVEAYRAFLQPTTGEASLPPCITPDSANEAGAE